jgi:hypothetical protein
MSGLPTPEIKQGRSRLVVLFGAYAMKFARTDEAERFADGVEANRLEASRWSTMIEPALRERLCPVLFAQPPYDMIVMQRAAPIPPGDFDHAKAYRLSEGEAESINCEIKEADWGVLDGRWVVVDYGNPD